MKEKNALKGERSRVLSQLKGLLEDRRRVKKLESLLEGNKAQIKAMQKENDTICKDYNSLLVQVKASIVDKKRLKDVQEALEKNKTDMNLLVKDSEAVKARNAKLKDKIKQFEEEQIKLVKERDTYKIADSAAKELKSGISDLEKEKSGLLSQLKQAQRENETVKKDYEGLLVQVNDRAKGIENTLVKSKANENSLMKEKNALKGERSRVLSQLKGLLEDRRRVKKLESLLEGNKAQIKAMQKENDTICKDYNSLLVQVKASIVDKKRLKDVQEALEKNKTDMNLLVKDSEAVKARNAKLKDKIKQFEEEQIKLVKERDTYKIADSAAKELKSGISDLEKEKSGLLSQLKQAQRENETVKKDYEGLLVQVNDLLIDKNRLKELSDIIEKNKACQSLLEKDNDAVKLKNLGLKSRVKELEGLQAQLSKARDEYKTAYENERNDAAKNELKDGIVKLEKEKNDIFSELKQTKNDNENVKKENLELRAKIEEFEFQVKAAHKQETSDTLMKELKQMQKENELIKKDYASLLAQMKELLADSRKVKEMGALLEKDKVNIALLEKEKEAARTENIALKDKAKKLEKLEKKLIKGTQDKGYDSESDLKRLKIKEIRPEDIILAKEDRQAALKQTEVKDAQLKELQFKFEAKKKQLSRQAEEYKKKYLKELERNDLAMQSASNLPQKFSDVVKKNEFLTRESAGMHYNLGVFFIKNKEYDRAIVEFEKAIELCPDDPYSYYNLGYIYAQYLIDRGKAVKYFRQYLQFVKNDDKDAEWVKDYLLTWEAYK